MNEELLDLYLLGRLEDEERLAEVEEHLLVCERCRNAISQMGVLRKVLSLA